MRDMTDEELENALHDRRKELFDLRFRFLNLVLAPPDQTAGSSKEQDDSSNEELAVLLEEIGRLVAAQIFIHLTNEGLSDVRGLRQRASVRSIGDPFAGSFPFPPRINGSWRRLV